MLNSGIALKIAKWCFAAIALWYGFLCAYTQFDTEVWVEVFDQTYTLWHVRAWIGVTSAVLVAVCELIAVEEPE